MMWFLLTGMIDLEFSGNHSYYIVWSSELETVQLKCFDQYVGPQVPILWDPFSCFSQERYSSTLCCKATNTPFNVWEQNNMRAGRSLLMSSVHS